MAFGDVFERMQEKDLKQATGASKMVGDLLSYNILANEKYKQIDELKKILDK